MKILDLSSEKKLRNVEHYYVRPNQLYHPTGKFKQDTYDIVYSNNTIDQNKFTDILLKEWFFLVKRGGYLIIDYNSNEFCNFKKLEEKMWWLWFNSYEILYHGESTQTLNTANDIKKTIKDLRKAKRQHEVFPENYLATRFICKKTKSTYIKDDSINKWSFGIITNGQRLDIIKKMLDAIEAQNIPYYEIIICGKYAEKLKPNMEYIEFNDRSNLGWLGKKKNLVVKQAKYENICMLHDRIILNKDWYKGMQKWGNCFEHLGCKQLYNDERAGDWVFLDWNKGIFYPEYKSEYNFVSMLDYKDYNFNSFLGGQLHILKKSKVQQVLWNETYHWIEKQPEDVEVTFKMRDRGYIPRVNPYATADAINYRFGKILERKYNEKHLGAFTNHKNVRLFGRFIIRLASIVKLDKVLLQIFYNEKLFSFMFNAKI